MQDGPISTSFAPPTFDGVASRARCRAARKRVLQISQQVPALHGAPAFSACEILDAVLNGHFRWGDGAAPQDVGEDLFVLSKGHAAILQYVALEARGVMSADELAGYCQPHGRLGAHPDIGLPGIAASTGSLGHGMGLAVGMALAERLAGRDARTFVVLSDGECQEGSTWEAAMMAANLRLGSIVACVDYNDRLSLDTLSESHPAFAPLVDKFAAFGWEAAAVDGHDAPAIHAAIAARSGDRPFVVVCRTVKGKGVSFMEADPIWHYRSPNPDELALALAEIDGADAAELEDAS